jgi:ABC-2 type transport system ATP-binding protein
MRVRLPLGRPRVRRAMAAIRVDGLRKVYGAVEAVAGISFEVVEGECFALLGPNGAGKTTTLEILEGYRDRSGGSVEVLGVDPAQGGRDLRERIGIVLQSAGIDRELTVAEVVALFGGYYPHPRDPGEVIELVGLGNKRDARCRSLSGGQQRRLDLALGIVGDPDLIFLDEPTTGFDPSARRQAWSVIENLSSLGKTILLTTHYMDEAQHLADRIAVIADGSIVAEGTPDTLGGRQQAEATVRFRLPDGVSISELPVQPAASTDGKVVFSTREPTRLLNQLTSWAIGRGLELDSLSVERPTLEDVYLQLVGDEIHV